MSKQEEGLIKVVRKDGLDEYVVGTIIESGKLSLTTFVKNDASVFFENDLINLRRQIRNQNLPIKLSWEKLKL